MFTLSNKLLSEKVPEYMQYLNRHTLAFGELISINMNFVLPDEGLENLICEFCQKFLSVLPVKIYPNGDVKCGRCSKNGDSGVISLFGKVAEKSLFRCINRFDGCRKLLETSQVLNHEAECDTKKYACPCCQSEFPTFLMPKHFKEKHPSLVLQRPFFGVDLRKLHTDSEELFFYRMQDDLFLVLCRFNEERNRILLNAFQFGEKNRASSIQQKFFVHCTGTQIETDVKPCVPYSGKALKNLGPSEGFVINLTGTTSRQYVNVELKLDVLSEVLTISRQEVQKVDGDIEHFRRLAAVCFQRGTTLPRKVHLDTDFKKLSTDICTDLDFYKLIKNSPPRRVEIILPCFICSDLNHDHNPDSHQRLEWSDNIGWYHNSVFLRKDCSYKWLCSLCYRFHKNAERDQSKFTHAELVLEYNFYDAIQYGCFWGCAVVSFYKHLCKHEFGCEKQPSQPCPVEGCIFVEKLSEIRNHFIKNHRGYLSLWSTFRIELTHNNFYIFECYVWTPPFFVMVIFCRSGSYWSVSIKMCEEHQAVKPKLLLFDKDWGFLLSVGTGRSEMLSERGDVGIKCYLEPK